MKYTIFFTYMLLSENIESDSYGYSPSIHCNYINNIEIDTILNNEINIYFDKINDFKFLTNIGGFGYSAQRIFILVQIVDNDNFSEGEIIKPKSNEWRVYDVTEQIDGYVPNLQISAIDLVSSIFKVTLTDYYTMPIYNLMYLNYPNNDTIQPLLFGDEYFLFGNVKTQIEAIAESMDIAIELPMGEYNTTNNLTWDGESSVYITEIGIYDDDGDLVAIGKLNNPVKKNSSISRTIVFGIDF